MMMTLMMMMMMITMTSTMKTMTMKSLLNDLKFKNESFATRGFSTLFYCFNIKNISFNLHFVIDMGPFIKKIFLPGPNDPTVTLLCRTILILDSW